LIAEQSTSAKILLAGNLVHNLDSTHLPPALTLHSSFLGTLQGLLVLHLTPKAEQSTKDFCLVHLLYPFVHSPFLSSATHSDLSALRQFLVESQVDTAVQSKLANASHFSELHFLNLFNGSQPDLSFFKHGFSFGSHEVYALQSKGALSPLTWEHSLRPFGHFPSSNYA